MNQLEQMNAKIERRKMAKKEYTRRYKIIHPDWRHLPEVRKDPSIPYGQTVYKPKNPFQLTENELEIIGLKYAQLIKIIVDNLWNGRFTSKEVMV